MELIPLALTYDDVLLVPTFSEVRTRRDVDCTACFTKQISLRAPFLSANMDTVTEAPMAIAVAEFGGIGVIHRFLSIESQVAEVSNVKGHQSEIIGKPYTISPQAKVGQARHLMIQLGISGLPVMGQDRRLVGMLTHRDMVLADDDSLVSERMTPWGRLVVGPPGITAEQARRTLSQHRLEKLPLVDGEGRLVGLINTKTLSRAPDSGQATRDRKGRLRVAAAVGVVGDFLERAQALAGAEVDGLVVDIAHGDSSLMLSAICQLRKQLGDIPLVAGNVATPEGTERLIDAGVDAVKVGVGPGSMCITRQVAGVGVPQFTAVLETARVARQHDIPVIADGGIRYPGDVTKAIGAGASTVMLGNLLAGTEESTGVTIVRNGLKMKISRGMASKEAATDRALRHDSTNGRAHAEPESDAAPEGVQACVPYRGTAHEVLQQLLAGLRSGMSYCNAATITQLWQNAKFIRQTQGGIREAGPHGVGDF